MVCVCGMMRKEKVRMWWNGGGTHVRVCVVKGVSGVGGGDRQGWVAID